eukprot:1208751-Pleurochrysis_carterae.AAC.5
MVAASRADEGNCTPPKAVRAARKRSTTKWILAEGLRKACGEDVSPRTWRKSARSANGRASTVWNEVTLAV